MPEIKREDSGTENNFTAIRMLAAISVLWGHAYALAGRVDEPTAAFFHGRQYIGDIAVNVFFITSGFLLARSFSLRQDLASFVMARVLRIYPGLIVCNLAIVAMSMALFHPWDWSFLTAQETVSYLTTNSVLFPQNYVIFHLPGVFGGLPDPSVNGSFWTLPAEIKAYAYMVGLLSLALLLRARDVCPPMAVLYATMTGAAAFAFPALPGFSDTPFFQRLIIYFFVGATAFELRQYLPLNWFAALGFGLAIYLLRGSAAVLPLGYVAWPYLTLFAAYKLPYAKRLNKLDISYGLYIYGFFSQNLIVWAVSIMPMAVFWGGLAVASVPAMLSWILIEQPFLAMKSKRFRWKMVVPIMPSPP